MKLKYILASGSERRQELLHRIVEDFNVSVSDFDETEVVFNGDIDKYVKELALGKALNVKEKQKKMPL